LSLQDKIKWNNKYSSNLDILKRKEVSFFLKKNIKFAKIGDALDLASGGGRHSIFLESLGFMVDAIDISDIAIDYLKSLKNKNINAILCDLDKFEFTKNYDLIVKINFLDKTLINRAKKALKVGGVFIIESYLQDKNNQKKHSNDDFLLKKDELKSFFKNDFEILDYQEFWNEGYEKYKMKKAAIAAKKIN
jgi:SAM-dependent methyltransferase